MLSSVRRRDLPSALVRFDWIEERLGDALPAVFLDYDGTLTPIVARPELAVMGEEMKQTLRYLGDACPVAVVSGRACSDVRNLVGIRSIHYAGNHGFEIQGAEGSGIWVERGKEYIADIKTVSGRLRPTVEAVSGAIVEDKRFSLSVHYRLADPARIPELERALDAALADQPRLRKHHGKMVFEVRPRIEWDKGRAVLWLLEALGLDHPGILPLYLGDDVTDEDAFRALRGRGVGILVADTPGESSAEFTLRDTSEVRQFLDRLAKLLGMRVR